jgi:tetratricopeptide (TPR) repeat protein
VYLPGSPSISAALPGPRKRIKKGTYIMKMRMLLPAAALCIAIAGSTISRAQTPPFAGQKPMTCAEALKQAPKDDPELAPVAKALGDYEAKLKKTPKAVPAKKAVVDAAFKYGDMLMHLPQGKLSPRIQYRAALALFRRALELDPKHKGSMEEKQAIEDIYRNMPGGIPK